MLTVIIKYIDVPNKD